MPKFAANLSMLFTELPFLDRFEAAASAGFEGVEFLFPYDYEADDLAARLKANGLRQVLFNMPAGNWAVGERGIAIYPNTVREFREGVARADPLCESAWLHATSLPGGNRARRRRAPHLAQNVSRQLDALQRRRSPTKA